MKVKMINNPTFTLEGGRHFCVDREVLFVIGEKVINIVFTEEDMTFAATHEIDVLTSEVFFKGLLEDMKSKGTPEQNMTLVRSIGKVLSDVYGGSSKEMHAMSETIAHFDHLKDESW